MNDTYKYSGEYNITGRGLVVTLNLPANGLQLQNKDLTKQFFYKEIVYKGNIYVVTGIESMKSGSECECENVGLLLRLLKDRSKK
jgi:hypothetical protein